MIIEFQGAARTVTGSMHLLHINGKRVVLDCGLFQGKREESERRNRTFPFDPASIDALILSHAHIDHSGNLPNLVKQGYSGPIYCTSATYDLCQIMLADSAHIQERDAEFVTKKHLKRGEAPVLPLYTVNDAKAAMKNFKRMFYNQEFEVIEGVQATFFDAGHILGSASVRMKIRENGITKTLGFSGDIGRWNMPIIRDPQFMGDVEVLMSESTYGGIEHDPPSDMESQLAEVIVRTVNRGGKLIVPAFSVGRTQDLIYALHVLREKGKLPQIPIFLDSPLAVNATDIFRRHPECFDEITHGFLLDHRDPFGFDQLHFIRSVDDSKRLNAVYDYCRLRNVRSRTHSSSSGKQHSGRTEYHPYYRLSGGTYPGKKTRRTMGRDNNFR